MNIAFLRDASKPRHRVWCVSGDLTAGADGSYTFKNGYKPGDGSEIIVMDMPGIILYWSEDEDKAYDWTTATSGE